MTWHDHNKPKHAMTWDTTCLKELPSITSIIQLFVRNLLHLLEVRHGNQPHRPLREVSVATLQKLHGTTVGTGDGVHWAGHKAVFNLASKSSATTLEPLDRVWGAWLYGRHSHRMLLRPSQLANLCFDHFKGWLGLQSVHLKITDGHVKSLHAFLVMLYHARSLIPCRDLSSCCVIHT